MELSNGVYESMSRPQYVAKTKPFEHQARIVEETGPKPDWAYFMEMGTGKSKICVDISGRHYAAGNIDAVLVIAPGGCYRNWKSEYEDHYGLPFDICVWESKDSHKVMKQKTDWIFQPVDGIKVAVVNAEALNFKGGKWAEAFCKHYKNRFMMVIDESTCIKNYKSKKTKVVKELKSYAKIRRIMTGTAITKSPEDLWGQCLALNGNVLGDRNFTSFKGRYAIEEVKHYGSHSFRDIVGWRNLDRLNQVVTSFSTIMEKSECHDIPKLFTKRQVELTPEQQKIYNEIRDLAITEIEGVIVDVQSAMNTIQKLLQVVYGQVKLEDGTVARIPNNRIQATLDYIDELREDKKLIIWAGFIGSLEEILEALREKFGEEAVVDFYGATSSKDRIENDKRFKHDPTCRFMVSNPQTGGEGNSWHSAHYCLYYSNTHNLKDRLQSQGRIDRIVQQANLLTYTDLFCPGTVEERVVEILRNNRELGSAVLGTKLTDWI
jgi:SNF2 family DNA or RNA helicase